MTGRPQQVAVSCVAKTGREIEEEFLLCSLLKENLECVEVSCDNSSPMELTLGQDQRDPRRSLAVCLCLWHPNQDYNINKAIFGSLSQVLCQYNLVLRGDLTQRDICWKNSAAAPTSSIKFLECVEDCFLTQMLDVSTRNAILLEPLKTKKNYWNISVNDSLGCSDHNILEFGILLNILKTSAKEKF